ncbi:putative exocyst complex component sec6 [Phaeomoniella chlamydospora]|uniref:Putative exocyst complex component sec6 n=1 Tax=Phaeomoniella chlamydospora TaxID=158046 RepID=A0A0G2F266_PHACM|nr:putative exocyst complex component sec6 [Phaeomoniella chlamydospora]
MADPGATDGGIVVPRIADLLRTSDDLEKIPALKAEFTRKKGDIDARLREGLKEQLEATQGGMNTLSEGQKLVGQIRDEMKSIHDLCEQAQAIRKDFPQIDYLAKVNRNFEAARAMQAGLASFQDELAEVQRLLSDDEMDLEEQPNLLAAHMKLTKLRDFRDEAMDQISRSKDSSLENTLLDWFKDLDDVIEQFDDHIGTICMNLIPLVQRDSPGVVVRLAIVIASEEKNDAKVQALKEAQRDHQDLVSKFTSFTIGPKTIRGYKEKFLQSIVLYGQTQFEETKAEFEDNPEKLDKHLKWFFNDLFACKQGMQTLFPKKWKIYQTWTNAYHKLMHDFLMSYINSDSTPPAMILAIIHYIEKYYKSMRKLGVDQASLKPHVIDNKEGDLVREWRNLIIKALTEWIDRMYLTDRNAFLSRAPESLDQDGNGQFRTKTLPDMWRMLREQTLAAGDSQREDVVEGVITAMFSALKNRQQQWTTLIDDEVSKFKNFTPELTEGLNALQDWLIAISNDQIACIDDGAAANASSEDLSVAQLGYLTRFKNDYTPFVSQKYLVDTSADLEALRDGYVDLSTHSLSCFVSLIFSVDFRPVLPDLFIPSKWYNEYAVKRIISTFEDYVNDYSSVLHPSLLEIFVEELSDELLIRYLSSIRNKTVKFRRTDPFAEKFREDILTAFEFFGRYPGSFNETIKPKWKVVDYLVRLLEADKANVVDVYQDFKMDFWDLQLSWVESVLRSRDDFERSMLNAVKSRAAEVSVERGGETIMGKVK